MVQDGDNISVNEMNEAESSFPPTQWEMSLQSNNVSHWLGTNLESAMMKLPDFF